MHELKRRLRSKFSFCRDVAAQKVVRPKPDLPDRVLRLC